MWLKPLNQACGTQACPRLFVTDHDTIVVQGTLLSAELAGVSTDVGEALVEVPRSVVLEALQRLASGA
jgi:hypothetical protein